MFTFFCKSGRCRIEVEGRRGEGARRDTRRSGIGKRFEIPGFLSGRQVSGWLNRRSSARDENKFLPFFFF
jgi:hypothetical protein